MRTGKLVLWYASAVLLLTAFGRSALAQKGEIGFGGGGSIYLNSTVAGPSTDAKVGFGNGFSAGVWGAHNMYRRLGGEIRYLFEHNKLEVSSGSNKATFAGRSHAIHYNLVFYDQDSESRVRPFFAVGGGVKGYEGTGEETAFQPLQNVALLTKTSQWKPLIVFGGGFKFAVGSSKDLRVEFYDYFTPFPTEVIAPAPGADFGGWIHNFVPTIGLSFVF
jgi:hypothetical protein